MTVTHSDPPETRRGVIGPFTGRQLATALVVVVGAALVLVVATQPLVGPGPSPAPVDPRATQYAIGSAGEGLHVGRSRPRARGHRPGRLPGTPARPRRQPGPPGRPARQAGLDQLLGQLVPALPGRDADDPRHGRRLRAAGPGGRRDQRPGGDRGRRPGLRREVRPGVHRRGGPGRRRLPALPGLRPADAVLPRRGRGHPVDRAGPGRRRRSRPRTSRSWASRRRHRRSRRRRRPDGPCTRARGRDSAPRAAHAGQHAPRGEPPTGHPTPAAPRRTGRARARAGPPAARSSCERTTVQRSSAARAKSVALRATESSGKSSKAGIQRGFADQGRIAMSPEEARACVRAHGRRSPGGRRCDRPWARPSHARAAAPSHRRRPPRRPTPARAAAPAGRRRRRSAGCRRGRSPTPRAGRRSGRAGRRALPSARRSPPAWS